MEFIDLKSQQKKIRSKIEKRIHAILNHGKYIMGPEVYELEEKLADYAGVKHCIQCSSGTDALLIKYDSTGARQWVRQFGSSSDDFGEAVVVDSAGNSYVLGKTESSVDGHENLGGSDVFVIKFDADGNR